MKFIILTNKLKKQAISDNWHNREFAGYALRNMFEENFDEIYPIIKKWTNNKNDRVRRASCLACMHRKKFGTKNRIVKILKLLEVLMKDDSKYVKKCCGPFVVGYLGYTYPQITLNWLNNQAIKTDENIRWNVAKSFSQALGRRFPHESLNILSKINYNDSKYVKSAIMSSLKNIQTNHLGVYMSN